MIHKPNQKLAVDIFKVLPKEETYAYATNIWVEGFGDIVAEVPAIVLVLNIFAVSPAVYVKGACDVGGRIKHVGLIKGSGTAREALAKIVETFLYGGGDIIVKGRFYPAWLYAQFLGQGHVTITKIAPGIEICYGGIDHTIV